MLRRIVAMLAFSGALAGFAVSLTLPRRYVGHGSVPAGSKVPVELAADRTLAPESLARVIGQSPYYRRTLDYMPMGELIEEVRANTVIESEGSRACKVEFTDDDRYNALDTTRSLLDEVRKNLETPDPAGEVRVRATGPSAALCSFEGFLTGLATGLIVWFARGRKG
jgi:hypothetical protein